MQTKDLRSVIDRQTLDVSRVALSQPDTTLSSSSCFITPCRQRHRTYQTHSIRRQIHALKTQLKHTYKREKQTKNVQENTRRHAVYTLLNCAGECFPHSTFCCLLVDVNRRQTIQASNLCDIKRDNNSSMQLSEVNSLFQYKRLRVRVIEHFIM